MLLLGLGAGLAFVMASLSLLPAPVTDASFNATLVCEPAFNGALCEAAPQGAGYSYAWSTSGYAYIPSPCSGPICSIACWGSGGNRQAHVTVTGPGDAQDSASDGIRCTSGGF